LLEELRVPYELDVHHRLPSMLAPPELEKIHPLGKSPLVTVTASALAKPIVLAESGFIVQYLSEHFPSARRLFPTRWKESREGTVGGETEEWMRYQYLMYYAEGSFMTTMSLHFIMMVRLCPFLSWGSADTRYRASRAKTCLSSSVRSPRSPPTKSRASSASPT